MPDVPEDVSKGDSENGINRLTGPVKNGDACLFDRDFEIHARWGFVGEKIKALFWKYFKIVVPKKIQPFSFPAASF